MARCSLAGRVALVTGGAKRVGRAISLRLAAEGMDIALTFNTSACDAMHTVRQIQNMGRRAHAIEVDLAQANAADHVYRVFTSKFERLDALINNASCFTATPLGQITASDFQQHMTVNAMAPLMLIQNFTPLLSAGFDSQRGDPSSTGRVINLADEHVLGKPLKNFAAYNASKAALVEITKSCALELAPKVTVNGIAPGVVAWNDSSTAQWREAYLASVPLARIGSGEEVAAAALFLVRDAGYCTGQIIPVDGGRGLT